MLVIATLVFMPWAIGSMHVWSQVIAAGLALAAFVAALGTNPTASGHARRKLVRFPGFWAGLAVLGYVSIQALNPAWVYRANESYWWLEPVDAVVWLPSGMDTPFADFNQWRAIMVLAGVWSLVCAVWIGFRRRRPFQILAIALAANACLLSIVAPRGECALSVLRNTSPARIGFCGLCMRAAARSSGHSSIATTPDPG